MRNRKSQFPVRETQIARHQRHRAPLQLPKGVVVFIAFIIFAAGIWLFARNELEIILDDTQKQFLEPLLSRQTVPRRPVERQRSAPPPSAPKMKSKPEKNSKQPPAVVESPMPVIEVAPYVGAKTETVPLRIGSGFQPAGIKIGAVSRAVPLSGKPDRLLKRLPRFQGRQQKFGVIKFANGLQYRFAIDAAKNGYQLFLDQNRNGDLRDDGAPLPSRGNDLFATTVSLPLDVVTGIPALKGTYSLWLFTNKSAWKQNSLRFYSKTQLSGQLRLGGKVYTAYLADNYPADGDYRNDGISIDLNGNGKIERKTEYFAPDTVAQINGRLYRFDLRR